MVVTGQNTEGGSSNHHQKAAWDPPAATEVLGADQSTKPQTVRLYKETTIYLSPVVFIREHGFPGSADRPAWISDRSNLLPVGLEPQKLHEARPELVHVNDTEL